MMMASVVSSANREPGPNLKGVDPETCMIVFKNHWAQVLRILEKHEPACNGGLLYLDPISGDEASTVQNYVEHMLFLLTEEECGVGGAMGPILEFVLLENVMERLFVWSLRRDFTDAAKLEQLQMYEMLLARARQPLLHHKPILRPLAMLLSSCGSDSDSVMVEVQLVRLLHRLSCMLVHDDSALQLFLFHSGQDHGAANFLLFSLLLPFVHREGPVGAQARDALALIVEVSAHDSTVADHITQNTYFCPVLATGLSGLYSCLPAKLDVFGEGWICLEEADYMQVSAVTQFLNSLQFCSTVCKVAHHSVRDQLLGYTYNGFLVPVMAPALHKLTLEEVMTSTAYLELFLRSISEPMLLQTFLIFIFRHRHDNINILDTLVSRINTPFQLGTVSLVLFRTLIGLYCEDVMLQLILRYLIPCTHLRGNERRRLRERDCYSSSAAALFSLTPSFLLASSCPSPMLPLKPDYILWSKVTEGNMGFEDVLFGTDDAGHFHCMNSESLLDKNYLQYLNDARSIISTGVQACQVWSAPYDGLNPPPEDWYGEEEFGDEDCPPLSTPSLQPATAHRHSDSSLTQTPVSLTELEWDDTYDAASDEQENQQIPERPEPPKHIQEMQKSAIVLIHGSYVEESDFQDDVLVYNLISQRDTRDDRRLSLKSMNQKQIDTNNPQPHTDTSTHQVQNHLQNKINNKIIVDTSETQEQGKSVLLNGHIAEAHREQVHYDPAHHQVLKSKVHPKEDDFISQCLQLIRMLEGEEESILKDEVHFQRLTILLHGEELETDFNLFRTDGYEDEEENNEEKSKSDGKKCVPFTGPFISVLLSRLENMLENSVEVNLLLTGILAQLAAYPQPLLRCFLLGNQAIFHPSVRSLYQVLVSVGCQIEQYASSRPEFAQMVQDSAQYLLLKDQAMKDREWDFLQENRLGWCLNGHVSGRLLKSFPPCPTIPPQCRNRVFATFLYAEFLKELAAIAQEHSIRPE